MFVWFLERGIRFNDRISFNIQIYNLVWYDPKDLTGPRSEFRPFTTGLNKIRVVGPDSPQTRTHQRRLLWHQMPKSTPRNHSKTIGIGTNIKHTACPHPTGRRTTGSKARLGTHRRLLRYHLMVSASVNSEKEEDIYLDLITQYEKCGTRRFHGPNEDEHLHAAHTQPMSLLGSHEPYKLLRSPTCFSFHHEHAKVYGKTTHITAIISRCVQWLASHFDVERRPCSCGGLVAHAST